MVKALLKVSLYLITVLSLFIYAGYAVTDMTGGFDRKVIVEGVNAKAGERIFFGKGKCSTCHSIGAKGSAIRCPNLGIQGESFTQPIGERIKQRAVTRSEQTGKKWKPVDYLFEALFDPGAYIVEGYKNEMPIVYKPPISLSADEIKAVIIYLTSIGGDIASDEIVNPSGIAGDIIANVESNTDEDTSKPLQIYINGDAKKGKELFWNVNGNAGCAKCHSVGQIGGKVGPPLTDVASVRDLKFIIESIVAPSASIANGYQSILILTKTGERITGTVKADTAESIILRTPAGESLVIEKQGIKRSKLLKKSMMPDNFAEILSVKEFYDILAYVQTLTDNTPSKGGKYEE